MGLELSEAKADHGLFKAARVVLAFATVSASWFVAQLIFALHYAHEYYSPSDTQPGALREGLKFPEGGEPDYWDFLHFSIIIGVAAQTADIAFDSRRLRRIGTVHSLLALRLQHGGGGAHHQPVGGHILRSVRRRTPVALLFFAAASLGWPLASGAADVDAAADPPKPQALPQGGASPGSADSIPTDKPKLRAFCADRPAQATLPCTVDKGHFQLETDIFNATYDRSGGSVSDTYLFTNPTLKLGIAERTDIEGQHRTLRGGADPRPRRVVVPGAVRPGRSVSEAEAELLRRLSRPSGSGRGALRQGPHGPRRHRQRRLGGRSGSCRSPRPSASPSS